MSDLFSVVLISMCVYGPSVTVRASKSFQQGGVVDKNEEEITKHLNGAITLLTGGLLHRADLISSDFSCDANSNIP